MLAQVLKFLLDHLLKCIDGEILLFFLLVILLHQFCIFKHIDQEIKIIPVKF